MKLRSFVLVEPVVIGMGRGWMHSVSRDLPAYWSLLGQDCLLEVD
jgi:hypothetical protein